MNRLNDLMSALFRRVTAKKIFLYTLAVFLIVLPVSIAVLAVSSTGVSKTSESTITVTLKDAEGNVLASEVSSSRDLGGESLASIIHNLNEGKTKTESAPILEKNVKPLIATIDTENERTSFACYFSVTGGTSYCIDEAGVSYTLNALDAADFLTSEYSEILYPNAEPPILKTIDGEAVLPISLEWNYKNVAGNFVKASQQTHGDTEDEYSITGQIDVDFTITPSSSQATVYDIKGEKIFEGSTADLKNLIVYASDSVRVVINAYWQKSDSSAYYGYAHYDFNVIIANRSDFAISDNTLSKNGFIILEATNIEDLSKIKFESPQSSVKPEFIFFGSGLSKAILTFPSDIGEDQAIFSFTVSYRASVEKFSVTLDRSGRGDVCTVNIPRPVVSVNFGETVSSEIRSHLKNTATLSLSHYNAYNTDFVDLSKYGFVKNIDFGDKVFYADSVNPVFTSVGCEFVCESYGVSVPALNAGMVVSVGYDDHLGKFAVVDHGMGLNVWYCNLSDIDVRENSLVTKGQSIGKTSRSEISAKEGFWIYVTFKDRMINPNEIIK